MPVASLCPAPLGPRNRSQFSACSMLAAIAAIAMANKVSRRGAEALRE